MHAYTHIWSKDGVHFILNDLVLDVSVVCEVDQDVLRQLKALHVVHSHDHEHGLGAVGKQEVLQLHRAVTVVNEHQVTLSPVH